MVSTGTSSDAPLPCEKRRALFHSTLEPKHPEVFGKSLAESAQLHFREFHLNFVKQRRNTCKRPSASQDFNASAKQAYKCTATLLEPQYDDTSEARVGRQGLKSKLRATRTSSRMLLKHLECFSAHHAHSKHLTSSSKQETLSSQAPNMLCPCLLLLTPNKRFKHSSQLMQCKLVVHVTCARHPVNCKGTHKEVKNFHSLTTMGHTHVFPLLWGPSLCQCDRDLSLTTSTGLEPDYR